MHVELIGKFYYPFIVWSARSKTNVFYVVTCIHISCKYTPGLRG